ncbi:hypothetical protein HDU87_003532 [Geranomyces variabilis]|uniref:Phospholipid-transporting ATPase n=1 Tax=Geranomyces variabilis TaxID=109894 RepID=A0AAD5XR80_9FUNG|nr:hypothetical protein HDU87_003532 [Geranomyces variabilis]
MSALCQPPPSQAAAAPHTKVDTPPTPTLPTTTPHPHHPSHPSLFARFAHLVRSNIGLNDSLGPPSSGKGASSHHPPRTIHVNVPIAPDQARIWWPPNKIRTAKYTPFTFIPRNLFEQFRRLANVYFLFTVIMQVFPDFAVTSPILAAMPLMIIMGITGIKDGFEDWRRHKIDNTVNLAKTLTLANWQNVHYPESCQRKWWQLPALTANHPDPNRSEQPPPYTNGTHPVLSPTAVPRRMLLSYLPRLRPKSQSQTVTPANEEQLSQTDSRDSSGSGAVPLTGWLQSTWMDLKVGDFVLLRCDDRIPADVLILSSNDPCSLAYVETKGLDGETNLISCEGLKETSHIRTAADARAAQLTIEVESPTLNLYTFNGTLTLAKPMESVKDPEATPCITPQYHTLPLNIQNILLRGSTLRNTEWVLGLVLFTGPDTKVILNSGQTPSKRSLIEKLMNWQVAINFLLLITMCVVVSALDTHAERIWGSQRLVDGQSVPWIVYVKRDFTQRGIHTFFASMIMLQNVVPISLYITIETVKTIQAYFIYSDLEMYHEPTDDPCMPKSWNISDDLGQIEYLFSDKTGTLTQNKMDFLRCSIAGVSYGQGYTDVTADTEGIDAATRARRMAEMSDAMKADCHRIWYNPYLVGALGFVDPLICEHHQTDPAKREEINQFFTMLAVCHTVASPKESFDGLIHPITYSAQSPDEQALVAGAKDFGVVFTSREQDIVRITVHGQPRLFRVLHVLEFTSTRKRMSVIVQDVEPPHAVTLFTKGADSVIYERLQSGQTAMKETTLQHLEKFANEGLRTLVLASRTVPAEEMSAWQEQYHRAACALTARDEALEAVAELIEVDLMLVGATAIEDKLQEQVPECITLLRSAGIKLWVLTGDKLETALNISFAANLLTPQQTLLVLRAHTDLTIISQLMKAYEQVLDRSTEVAMIIDGESLGHALATEEGSSLLLEVGTRCVCVVCCRVSPKQKAQVVRLVKRGKNVMCAAIGDGANDVSMIQEAHIGIGISGQEGLQAALAADYVIAQFRFLSRLILVHGRWSYYRTSETILNFFYKNMTWVFSLFWYQLFCGFSGKILFDYTYLMFFNLLFTSLPSLVLGVFDQDVSAAYALSIPPLYAQGLQRTLFTTSRFFNAVLSAVYQSLVCFFIPYMTAPSDWSSLQLGSMVALSVIVTVNAGVALSTKNWTWVVAAASGCSIASFIIYIPLYAVFPKSQAAGTLASTYGSPIFWAAVVLSVVVALAPRVAWGVASSLAAQPGDLQIVRERQKYDLGVPPRVVRVGEKEADVVLVEETLVGRRESLRQLDASRSAASLQRVQSHASESGGGASGALHGQMIEEDIADEDGFEHDDTTVVAPPRPIHRREGSDIESQMTAARRRNIRSAPPGVIPRIITTGGIMANTAADSGSASSMSSSAGHLPQQQQRHHQGNVRTSLHFMDSGAVSANTGFAFSFDDHFAHPAITSPVSSNSDLGPRGAGGGGLPSPVRAMGTLRSTDAAVARRVASEGSLWERSTADGSGYLLREL